MNLFELNTRYEELKNRDDLDPTVLVDTLDSIKDARQVKWDNIATWMDSNKSDINWINQRVKELREKKQFLENQNSNLMTYLTDSLDDAGLKKTRTANHLLSTRNFKASTVIDDEDKIPGEYRNYTKYEGMYDVEKSKIYKALKAGEQVPGAHLQPNRRTVIK